MIRQKTHRDGWGTAMEPTLVASTPRERHVSRAEKQRDADVLRANVEAHIAAGGDYQVLLTTPSASVNG